MVLCCIVNKKGWFNKNSSNGTVEHILSAIVVTVVPAASVPCSSNFGVVMIQSLLIANLGMESRCLNQFNINVHIFFAFLGHPFNASVMKEKGSRIKARQIRSTPLRIL